MKISIKKKEPVATVIVPAPAKVAVTMGNAPIRNKAVTLMIGVVPYLNQEKLVGLEQSIYDNAVNYAREQGTSAKMDNRAFQLLYISRLRHLLMNLNPASYLKNHELTDRLTNNSLSTDQLLALNPREIMPSRWTEYEQKESAEIRVITQGELVATTTLYTCSKCHHNKCSYYQQQIRSIDEGITNCITCLSCGHFWRQNN